MLTPENYDATARGLSIPSKDENTYMNAVINYKGLPPSLTDLELSYPSDNNSYYNYNTWNGTIILIGNENLNYCEINNTIWNISSINNKKIAFYNYTALTDGVYELFINCNDTSSNYANLTIKLIMDNSEPTITNIQPDDESTNISNLTHFATFKDNNAIWQYNVSVFNGSTLIWNNYTTNISLSSDITEINFTRLYNYGSGIENNYTYKLSIWDSHTKKNIKKELKDNTIIREKLNYDDDENYISQYFINTNTDINIYYPKKLFEIKHYIENDRIKYFIERLKDSENYYFILSSNKKINYLPNSKFSEHFIINNYYWFDTKGLKTNEIIKINDYNYIIKFDLSESVLTESTGILNYYSVEKWFYIDNKKPIFLNHTKNNNNDTIRENVLFNEPVNYTYIFGLNCSHNLRNKTNSTYATNYILREYNLANNTIYYFNITFWDRYGNKNNTCFLSFTEQTTTETEQEGQFIEGNITTAIMSFLLIIIYFFFLFVTVYFKDSFIGLLTGFYGIMYVTFLWNQVTAGHLPLTIFAIFNIVLIFLIFKFKKPI
jgi:hypothetical protein